MKDILISVEIQTENASAFPHFPSCVFFAYYYYYYCVTYALCMVYAKVNK